MSVVEKAAPAVATPVIGQAYGGGFVIGITRDPVTGKRSLHISAGAADERVDVLEDLLRQTLKHCGYLATRKRIEDALGMPDAPRRGKRPASIKP